MPAGFIVKDGFRRAAEGVHEERFSHHHAFDGGQAEGFGIDTGIDDDVGGREVHLGVGRDSDDVHAALRVRLVNDLLNLDGFRRVEFHADENQMNGGVGDFQKRFEEQALAFGGVNAGDDGENARVRRDVQRSAGFGIDAVGIENLCVRSEVHDFRLTVGRGEGGRRV